MNVVARVTHAQPVAFPFFQMKGCGCDLLLHGIRNSIDRPTIKTLFGGIVFRERHIEGVVGSGSRRTNFAETRVIPAKRLGWQPSGFPLLARVFDDDAHAVIAIVVGQISHDPYARMIHLNNRRNPLRSSKPEHRHLRGSWDRIPVKSNYLEGVSGQRKASNLCRASVQNVKNNTLAPLHTHRLAVSKLPSVDGEISVSNLVAVRHAFPE